MSGVKRTRNSSELGPRKHDGRKKEVSQNANCWLGSKAEVKEKTPDEIRNDSKRRRVQKEGEWEIRRGNLEADDISGLEHVLQKGIECQGCIIPDEDVRRGHRAMRLDGSVLMKSRVIRVQPVTELILHPDAIESYEKLSPFARSNIEKNIDEAERFQQFADILTPGNNEEEKNEALYIHLHL